MVKIAAQVGFRTRARAQTLARSTLRSATAKKRSRHIKISIKVGSNVTHRGQQRGTIRSENSVSYPPDVNSGDRTVTEERCSSPSLDDDDDDDHHHRHALMSASCCSSNGSCDERIKFTDLKGGRVEVDTSMHYSSSSRERERTPISSALGEESTSENMDSTANPVPLKKPNSHRRSSTAAAVIKITDEEMEEFFGQIEKNVPQRFKDKYNFDFDKDEPLEGRYEWVRLNPGIKNQERD